MTRTTKDAHSRTSGDVPEPLYDVDVPTPTHAEQARTLAERIGTATLCTVAVEPAGYPYGSFVTFALDDGHPVFLISALAEHTKNLKRDPRGSVLIAEREKDDPLANGRVTLLGDCRRLTDDAEVTSARTAFLATHTGAAYYADFKDFAFWKLEVSAVRYIGGYGRMSWVTRDEWLAAEPDPLAPHAARIIAHMNEDHAEALVAYCRAYSRATDVDRATMTAVDRYGFEMSAVTSDGPRPVRLAFPEPVTNPDEVRKALVGMIPKTSGSTSGE